MPTRSVAPRRAFTLVELLVVMAIIAVLAGILMAALWPAQKASIERITRQRMTQIAGVLKNAYTEDKRNFDGITLDEWIDDISAEADLEPLLADHVAGQGAVDAWDEPLRFYFQTSSGSGDYTEIDRIIIRSLGVNGEDESSTSGSTLNDPDGDDFDVREYM